MILLCMILLYIVSEWKIGLSQVDLRAAPAATPETSVDRIRIASLVTAGRLDSLGQSKDFDFSARSA